MQNHINALADMIGKNVFLVDTTTPDIIMGILNSITIDGGDGVSVMINVDGDDWQAGADGVFGSFDAARKALSDHYREMAEAAEGLENRFVAPEVTGEEEAQQEDDLEDALLGAVKDDE